LIFPYPTCARRQVYISLCNNRAKAIREAAQNAVVSRESDHVFIFKKYDCENTFLFRKRGISSAKNFQIKYFMESLA
jgi:hypothetical protein